jgi:hypothetical protein
MMTYNADSPLLLAGATKTLTMITAVGAGVAGGVFFAFSTFVMPALHRLPKPQGMAAMQSINKAAPNPLFMAVLFGTFVLGVVVAVSGLRHRGPATPWLVAGAAAYLVQIVSPWPTTSAQQRPGSARPGRVRQCSPRGSTTTPGGRC